MSALRLPVTGEVIAGKYRLERQVGAGGMSVVFAAQHTTLRQRVAIKFLSLDQCESGAAVARFLHEGRSCAKIRSEHVARVIDVDAVPGGLPYMVLEYLEGHDLADTLRQRGPLPIDLAVDYVMQALEAIAEAHTLNIVHRDLKPSNLFVVKRADGKKDIKVIDFGISKSIGDSDQTAFTKRHSILGSPEYMSPEQAQGVIDIDPRTDLWSTGVVLYELLTGTCPFDGADYMEILGKVTKDDPPSLAARCPHIPPPLEQIVLKCLRRDRTARYQTAGELARALVPFGTERSRISYDSIIGVCLRAEAIDEPDSSTLVRAQPMVANQDVARGEWKNLATADLASAVDRAVLRAQTPSALDKTPGFDQAPTARATPKPGAVPGPVPPSDDPTIRDSPQVLATKPSAGVPEELRGEYEALRRAEQPPRVEVSSAPPASPRSGEKAPLISVVRGPLPSLSDDEATSSGEKWIRRPEIHEGTHRKIVRSMMPPNLQRPRPDLLLWGVCGVGALVVAIVWVVDALRDPPPAEPQPVASVVAAAASPPAAPRAAARVVPASATSPDESISAGDAGSHPSALGSTSSAPAALP